MRARAVVRCTAALQVFLLMAALVLPGLAAATEITTDLWVYNDGDTVTVTGIDFGANEVVALVTTDPEGTVVDTGQATTDDAGGFTYLFVLTVAVGGIYDVVATGQTSGLSDATQFDPPNTITTTTTLNLSSATINWTGSTTLSGTLAWTAGTYNQGQKTKDGRTIHLTSYTNASCSSGASVLNDATTSGGGASGTASYSFVYTPTTAGTRWIQASFDGLEFGSGSSKDTYTVSASSCLQLVVNKAGTTTSGSASTGSIFNTQSFTVSYSVLASIGVVGQTATGAIMLVKDSGPGGGGSLGCTPASVSVSQAETAGGFSQAGSAAFTCTPSGGTGTYVFHVHFGDSTGNYNNSDSEAIQVLVNAAHTSSLTESLFPSTIIYGQQTTASGILTDTTDSTPIALVNVTESERTTQNTSCGGSETAALGADATDGSGTYSLTFTPQGAGAFDIRARYAGDAGHAAATACATLTVNKAPTETSLVLADNAITTAESTTATGSVLSHSGISGNSAVGTFGFQIFTATDCTSGLVGAIGTDEAVNVAQGNADNNPMSEIGFTFASAGVHTISGLAAGSYGIRALFTDNNGLDGNYTDSSDCQTLSVVAGNQVPNAGSISGPSPVDEGSSHDYTSNAFDPDGDPLTYDWTIVSGPATISAGDGTDTVSLDFSDGPSTVVLHLDVDDGSGSVSPTDLSISVSNVTPTGTADNATVTVNEGATAGNTGTYFDPGDDPITLTASVGTMTDNANGTWSWSFGTTDGPDDSQTVTIYGDDGDGAGAVSIATFGLTVNNVKPTPTIDLVTGTGGAACIGGNEVSLDFSWTDPALTNDAYSYDVNWGDGSTHSTASGATSPVADLTHSYAAGGPYTIIVTVNDDDAGAGNTDSSAPFSFLYNTSGILQPINLTGARSSFKIGSTIPVKLRVFDCNNVSVSGLTLEVSLIKLDNSAAPANETVVSSVPDPGTVMRYSASSDPQYIYNLSTKRSQLCSSLAPCTSGGDLTAGTYQLSILGPIAPTSAYIDTRL